MQFIAKLSKIVAKIWGGGEGHTFSRWTEVCGKLVLAMLFFPRKFGQPSICRSTESEVSIRSRRELHSVSDSPLPILNGYIYHTSWAIRKGVATAAGLSSTHPNFTPESQYLSITLEGIKSLPWYFGHGKKYWLQP